MTTNPIDQLKQWYDDAEQVTETNLPRPGDTLIFPYNASGYAFEVEEAAWTPEDVVPGETVRIYSRAPKPAWHNAVAVIAHTDEGHVRQVWERDGDTGYWLGTESCLVRTDALRDVTPLIVAKATNLMRGRVGDVLMSRYGTTGPDGTVEAILTAALGIEAE